MIQHFARRGVAIFLFLLALFTPVMQAQEETRLQIATVDISGFPVVRVTVVTADSRSAPADLTNLALRENGIPVTDLTFDNIPVGIDATFVIDANTGFDEVDDESELTRRDKVRDSILRFAGQYMNGDGLDRISIVVPGEDGQSGQFLLQNESDPQEIIAAINAHEPARLGPTPLNAMLNLALEQTVQTAADSRYQALLLFSDARRLDEQLSYPLLAAQANDANIPIYGAILGESADEIELANMARLTEATSAFHLHMPQAAAADPIYQIWQQQGNPIQISYTTRQRQSGRSQITLNLDTILANTNFDVTLAPPTITLSLPRTEIRRVGSAPDTPLEALQPQVQPITVTISWPDGLPRKLIEIIFLTNNRPQRIAGDVLAVNEGELEWAWDIRDLDAGPVELVVQVLDELGYQGTSAPQTVIVTAERPLPPTAAPTLEPQEINPGEEPVPANRWQVFLVLALLLLLIVAVLWYWRNRTKKKITAVPAQVTSGPDPAAAAGLVVVVTAVLESITEGSDEVFTLVGSNISIGRDEQNAQIVLKDESISRLHARIRRQEQTYWLFDEGSAAGVFLNYERLGLAPRELQDGDIVQFGKLAFRFALRESLENENTSVP
jgi:hypothetical protein